MLCYFPRCCGTCVRRFSAPAHNLPFASSTGCFLECDLGCRILCHRGTLYLSRSSCLGEGHSHNETGGPWRAGRDRARVAHEMARGREGFSHEHHGEQLELKHNHCYCLTFPAWVDPYVPAGSALTFTDNCPCSFKFLLVWQCYGQVTWFQVGACGKHAPHCIPQRPNMTPRAGSSVRAAPFS